MRRVALLLAAVLPLTLAGCDDSTGPGGFIGTYNLQSVNGDAVPVSVGLDQLVAGWVRIEDDDSFSASHSYRSSANGFTTTTTTEFGGTYTRSGNDLSLTFPNPNGGTSFVTATWDGSRRLTVNDNLSGAWVYVR